MTNQFFNFRILSLLALLAGSLPAHADVTRCIDNAGGVSYTNGACGEGTRLQEVLLVERTQNNGFIYQAPPPVRQQLRDSPWANVYIPPRKRQPDVESIRSARLKIISTENMPRYVETAQARHGLKIAQN